MTNGSRIICIYSPTGCMSIWPTTSGIKKMRSDGMLLNGAPNQSIVLGVLPNQSQLVVLCRARTLHLFPTSWESSPTSQIISQLVVIAVGVESFFFFCLGLPECSKNEQKVSQMIYNTFFHHPLRNTKSIQTEMDFNTKFKSKRCSPDHQHRRAQY